MTPTPTPPRPPSGIWLVALLLIGGSALGWFIGWRLSTDTLAVVLGVAAGVVASVPAAILLLLAARRTARPAPEPEPAPSLPPPPPAVMINMAELLSRLPQSGYLPQPPVVIEGDARSIPGTPRIVGTGADDW